MKFSKYTFVFISFLFSVICQAAIYKWKDGNGNVYYSDKPHQDAQKINIGVTPNPESNQESADDGGDDGFSNDQEQTAEAVEKKSYQAINIVSPQNEETIRNVSETVVVEIAVSPELSNGDQVVIVMDGKIAAGPSSQTTLILAEVVRGEHKLQARVVDSKGNIVKASEEVTIYMHKPFIQRNVN